MTEEQIRKIVREEIENAAYEEGGILDEARSHSFSMTRGILQQVFANGLNSFDPPSRAGAGEEKTDLAIN